MITGIHYLFRPISIDRERLPVLNRDVVGREIMIRDQVGTMRLKPGDLVKLVELRPDQHSCLCSNSGCKGLLLTDISSLQQYVP